MLEDKHPTRTSLEQLGEFGLIEHLTQVFEIEQPTTVKGVGDDAAVLQATDQQTVISTEMLVEGVHFDLAFMPLKHLGYKAVVMGISDIVAMGAKPTQLLFSIGLSNRFPLEAVEELYAGVQLACKFYKVDLIGGDTTSSQKGLLLNVTAIGRAAQEEIVYRNGAKETDVIVVTGDLGAAYMGLQVLEREKQVFLVNPNSQPDLEPYTYLVERQLKPEARTDIKELLEKLEVRPTAMIDLSDGVITELHHICKASGVGCAIYEDKLPLDPQLISTCEEFNIDSTTVALNGGEDYELLFTIPVSDFDKIKHNPNLTAIGYITAESEGLHLISRAHTKIALKTRGWSKPEEA